MTEADQIAALNRIRADIRTVLQQLHDSFSGVNRSTEDAEVVVVSVGDLRALMKLAEVDE